MDAGGLAQLSPTSPFMTAGGMSMQPGGLASRRGGQGIKPLSIDALKLPGPTEPAAPTPRTTARAHLLAGLRTAPKSATATTFAASGTVGQQGQARNRNSLYGADMNGPKTSLPRAYGQQQQSPPLPQSQPLRTHQQQPQPQQQQQQQTYNGLNGYHQQTTPMYTADQILAPPEIFFEDQGQEQMDPALYANLVSTNAYLAQQQQRLQQQLVALQAAQQQFQGLNLGGGAYQNLYQQQLQQLQLQAQLAQQQQQQQQQQLLAAAAGSQFYTVFDPATGQSYVVDSQVNTPQNWMVDQYGGLQAQQSAVTPRVQVSPPPSEARLNGFRNPSPPRRNESPEQQPHTPLPPPSANAFRRGHKKSNSVTNNNAATMLSLVNGDGTPKSPGPKTANFPLTPVTGGYGPGQARAGEHPVRQPRGPPNFDELRSKPTSKHEGSKNFAGRTRRSALSNLVRAGITRRQATGSSGSISPISESAEEQVPTPLTEDDESVSGRSGSGSLNGDDVEPSLPSSRTSTGSWGAIGSDRPTSRQQQARKSVDSLSNASGDEAASSSFASIFKGKPQGADSPVGQRKAPMLVLNRGAEKRKSDPVLNA